MRALSVEELGFVAGGYPDDGEGRRVNLSNGDKGWHAYVIPRNSGYWFLPPANTGTDTGTGEWLEKFESPMWITGKTIDAILEIVKDKKHNDIVREVLRDRDGDGSISIANGLVKPLNMMPTTKPGEQ
jgi:hypothetical protein